MNLKAVTRKEEQNIAFSEAVSEIRIWIMDNSYFVSGTFQCCIGSSQHLVSITEYCLLHHFLCLGTWLLCSTLSEFFPKLQRFVQRKSVSGLSENTHARMKNQSHLIPVIDAWNDFSSSYVNPPCLHLCSLKLHFTGN